MKKLIISLIVLIIIVTGLIVLSNGKNNVMKKEPGKINVIATVYPVYDFAREVAGDKANVSMLIAPGVEIHDYEPTPQDIIKIQEADLFLYTGDNLEPWAKTVISGIDNKDNIKNVSTGISLIEKEDFEKKYAIEEHGEEHDEHGKYDTHIWLDITKSIEIVKNITNELCYADPDNAEYYKNRSNEYINKLQELDKNFAEAVKNGKRKKIAFGGPFSYAYLVERYDLDFVTAYDSCGENSEPSVDKISKVIQAIKKDKLPVVFYKELSSGNIVKTITEETGAEALELNSLHSITAKQLENGESYLTIMNKNLENLKKALQ